MGKKRKKGRLPETVNSKIVSIEDKRKEKADMQPETMSEESTQQEQTAQAHEICEIKTSETGAEVSGTKTGKTDAKVSGIETGVTDAEVSGTETGETDAKISVTNAEIHEAKTGESGTDVEFDDTDVGCAEDSTSVRQPVEVKVLEVDITDGQARGSRRAAREANGNDDEIEITIVDVYAGSMPKGSEGSTETDDLLQAAAEGQTDAEGQMEAEASALEITDAMEDPAERERHTKPNTAGDEPDPDETDWREDLAYLESEDYAPKRKRAAAEAPSDDAAETVAGIDMQPIRKQVQTGVTGKTETQVQSSATGKTETQVQSSATGKTETQVQSSATGKTEDQAQSCVTGTTEAQTGAALAGGAEDPRTEETLVDTKTPKEKAPEQQPQTAQAQETETSKGEKQAAPSSEKKKMDPRKRKRQVRLIKCAIFAVLILAVVGVTAFLYERYAPTSKQMETQAYYEWMLAREREEEEVTLSANELVVVLQDEISTQTALYTDDHVYLNYDMVRENIFTRFYWDESISRMLYTTADDTWQIPLNAAEYTTKDGSATYDVPMFISSGEEKYICADFLAQYVNMTCEAYPEENHVLVTYEWGDRESAVVQANTAVRFGAGIKQLVLTTLHKNDQVYVLSQSPDGTWTRVLTRDGYIGWVQTKKLSETETIKTPHDFEEEEITGMSLDEEVNLVWHQISSEDANKYFASATAGTSGVNVISPTWFSLTDDAGNFSSYGSKSYVTKAHKKGMQVWALIDNFSENMSTAVLTASYEARSALIANLIDQALELDLDGINIDFETISEAAGYSYVQFMRELSVATRQNGLILSVDIPVPMSYNTYYDRAELGRYCDYVIIMGYDEHYSGSEAGSVASLSFEETGIRETIAAGVPAAKLVSGVPFYTRLWYTATASDGSQSTWSEVYGMNTVSTTLDTYDVDAAWDDETQQNYAEWTLDDGTLCRIWIEDEESIAVKAKLVDTYELGGIAAWALGFERDSIWPVISEAIQ